MCRAVGGDAGVAIEQQFQHGVERIGGCRQGALRAEWLDDRGRRATRLEGEGVLSARAPAKGARRERQECWGLREIRLALAEPRRAAGWPDWSGGRPGPPHGMPSHRTGIRQAPRRPARHPTGRHPPPATGAPCVSAGRGTRYRETWARPCRPGGPRPTARGQTWAPRHPAGAGSSPWSWPSGAGRSGETSRGRVAALTTGVKPTGQAWRQRGSGVHRGCCDVARMLSNRTDERYDAQHAHPSAAVHDRRPGGIARHVGHRRCGHRPPRPPCSVR